MPSKFDRAMEKTNLTKVARWMSVKNHVERDVAGGQSSMLKFVRIRQTATAAEKVIELRQVKQLGETS